MSFKFFNPLFYWKKRKSILNRLIEFPNDVKWKLIYPYIKLGYVASYDYAPICSLKDSCKDKKAFLLGNGPSVQIEDLDRLALRDDFVVFGCNRIYLAYDKMRLRPDYLVSSDEMMQQDFGEEMLQHNEKVLFVSKKRPFFKRDNYLWFKMRNGRPFKFSNEVTKEVMVGGGTLISAIQIAKHMGIREMYIYGVDHSFNFKKVKGKFGNAVGEGNHFISNYRSNKKWQAPVMDLVEEAFVKCDQSLRKSGGSIKNITRGGHLEVLERANFDEIIP